MFSDSYEHVFYLDIYRRKRLNNNYLGKDKDRLTWFLKGVSRVEDHTLN